MPEIPSYIIITPARNEAQFIELTMKSVISQTVKPMRWVVVSDGSTDGTDEIVGRYASEYPWIQLLRMPERRERHFAGKVTAFNAALATIKDLDYRVIASLDADISFDEDYFAFLLQKLADNQTLGVVGTPFREGSSQTYDYRFVNIEHVSGACQVFRRRCFEEIGGYVPVEGGSIDHIAVISARMKGWKTRTFVDRVCCHHRPMGTAQHNTLLARFRGGRKDYSVGNHPLWELFRTAYQATKRPFVLGGLMLAAGYLYAYLGRQKRPVSGELVAFQRREQLLRLKRFVGKRISSRNHVPASS
jgi:biofilm PGA synthesis N-glycosyltransferase PgaC